MKRLTIDAGDIELVIALYDRAERYTIRIYNSSYVGELWAEDLFPGAAIEMFHRLVEHAIKSRKDWLELERELQALLRQR